MGNRCVICAKEATIYNRCIYHLRDEDRINAAGLIEDENLFNHLAISSSTKLDTNNPNLRFLSGQTYDQFVTKVKNKDKLRVILLVPLHESKLIDIIREYCNYFFYAPIVPLQSLNLASIKSEIDPELVKLGFVMSGYPLYSVDKIKDKLLKEVELAGRSDSIVIGITENHDLKLLISEKKSVIDIFEDQQTEFNPVIGHVYSNNNILIFSTRRFGINVVERMCKIVTRSICNLLGLGYCVFWRCLLNDVNEDEYRYAINIDTYPSDLCPVCLHKLYYLFKFDLERRKTMLETFRKKYVF